MNIVRSRHRSYVCQPPTRWVHAHHDISSPFTHVITIINRKCTNITTDYGVWFEQSQRDFQNFPKQEKKLSKILLLLQTRPYFSNKKIIFVRYRLHTTIRKQINMKWQTPYKMATLWASAISVRSVSTSKLTAQQHICWNQEGWWKCHCRRKHHIAYQEHGDERGIFPPPTFQRRVRLAGQHCQRTIVINW